jgi:hypothetical protein
LREVVQTHPEVFVPVKGGWGRTGNTNIRLRVAPVATVRVVLELAWRNIAPKRFVQAYDAA